MIQEIPNPQLQLAFDFVQQTNKNLFVTGKAGTGKTTFLRNLKLISPKRMIVLAPTGVAAINAGGVTIHSFFQMHFGPHIPGQTQHQDPSQGNDQKKSFDRSQRFSKEKINIIKSLDLLVIDEISMVRADLLDSIDEVLRRFRDRSKPFGGVQLLMIGDLQQLAPVAKDDEWELLRPYYDTIFFFGSRALQKTDFTTIELRHIYRQSDQVFINLLNKVRDNIIDKQALDDLNQRFIPNFNPGNDEGYISLTTHNYQSQAINENKLKQLKGVPYNFTAEVKGEFPEYSYPTDFELVLKVGAQVMFVKNDISREKLFYNGKIGKITRIDDETIFVKCEGDYDVIPVTQVEWTSNKYTINEETKEITETPVGSFIQYPLKLAWAITIHKSQGLTFERAIIDANAAFAHGQVYVALSRCKTMEGMVLSSRISQDCIKSDVSVKGFSANAEMNQPGERELIASRIAYQQTLLLELLDFSVIQRRLHYIQKQIKENSNVLLPAFAEVFNTMSDKLSSELIGIVTKFNPQIGQLLIEQPMIESNDALQERIKKACTYFAEKTEEHICQVLQNTDIETDNKEIKKTLREGIENLYMEAFIKTASFKACTSGFSVKTYLDAKAKASIEKIQLKKEVKVPVYNPASGSANVSLLQEIKAWRNAKADEEDLPLYMVLPQKTLYELVEKMPVTLRQLKDINGFGKKKVLKYGDELIALICSHRQIEVPEISADDFPLNERVRKPKPEKGQTQKLSLEMFRQGKTIEEIATERTYAVTTIEGHLSTFIENGEIDILELLSPEKLEYISEFYSKAGSVSLSEAINALGNKATYGELRMVRSYLFYQNRNNHNESE
jgi:energy-coupling factor transporter ATP-binding protein EcfA2